MGQRAVKEPSVYAVFMPSFSVEFFLRKRRNRDQRQESHA
jgi:hypothetical protein